MTTNTDWLIEAQMHLECLVDCLFALESDRNQSVKQEVMFEIGLRVRAALHLVQSTRLDRPDKELSEACRQANAFNGVDDGPVSIEGMH